MTVRPANWVRRLLWRRLCTSSTTVLDPLARDAVLARLEAALLLADEPLPLRRLAEVAHLPDSTTAANLLRQLQELYDADQTAFQIVELAGGYQLLTRPSFHPWLMRLRHTGRDLRLSEAAWEVLALVAYRQPITRAEMEKIRGVSVVEPLRLLMEKGLIRVVGRQESLGRPQLYGTTHKFLQLFGLRSLDELPHVELLKKGA